MYSVVIYNNKITFINDKFIPVSIEEVIKNTNYGYFVDNKLMDKVYLENEILKIYINKKCCYDFNKIKDLEKTIIKKINSLSELLNDISFIKR